MSDLMMVIIIFSIVLLLINSLLIFLIVRPLIKHNREQTEMINAKSSAEYQQYQLEKIHIESSDVYSELKAENEVLKMKLDNIEKTRYSV